MKRLNITWYEADDEWMAIDREIEQSKVLIAKRRNFCANILNVESCECSKTSFNEPEISSTQLWLLLN